MSGHYFRSVATACRLVLAAASLLILASCAAVKANNNAGDYVRAGGVGDQQKAAAVADLQRARTQNTVLQEEKLQRERELKRTEDRLRDMEAEVVRQDRLLADALKARQVSQQRANELKREIDAIRVEMQQLDLQNKSAAFGKADPAADKAKEERLRVLETRKKALEASLAQLVTTKW
jgi:chromosome segregation ATPase